MVWVRPPSVGTFRAGERERERGREREREFYAILALILAIQAQVVRSSVCEGTIPSRRGGAGTTSVQTAPIYIYIYVVICIYLVLLM